MNTENMEIRRLTTCISDLLSIAAMRSMSRGRDAGRIMGTLLEVLLGTLRLDSVYAEFKVAVNRVPIALVRFPQRRTPTDLAPEIRASVDAWLADRSQATPFVGRCPSKDGDLAFALVSLGFHAPIGWLLACSSREDFPTQTERLLLGVAANQAVISVQEAQLLSQQTQVAQELERKVALRTKELQRANMELEGALKQVDALRNALLRENLVLREQAGKALGGLAPWQLRRAEVTMSENLGGQMPLSQLAELCGLSVRHFGRAFRQSTGVPPHKWLLNRRVRRAEELLPDPKHSLSDVASACGFANQSHFTRTFSATLGMSPGLWRRLQSVSPASSADDPNHADTRARPDDRQRSA